jgi:hypothetical protein
MSDYIRDNLDQFFECIYPHEFGTKPDKEELWFNLILRAIMFCEEDNICLGQVFQQDSVKTCWKKSFGGKYIPLSLITSISFCTSNFFLSSLINQSIFCYASKLKSHHHHFSDFWPFFVLSARFIQSRAHCAYSCMMSCTVSITQVNKYSLLTSHSGLLVLLFNRRVAS